MQAKKFAAVARNAMLFKILIEKTANKKSLKPFVSGIFCLGF